MCGVNLYDLITVKQFFNLFICLTLQIRDRLIRRAIKSEQGIRQFGGRIAIQSCPGLSALDGHGICDGVGEDLVGAAFQQFFCLCLAHIGAQYCLAFVGHAFLKDIDIGIAFFIILGQILYGDFPVIAGHRI